MSGWLVKRGFNAELESSANPQVWRPTPRAVTVVQCCHPCGRYDRERILILDVFCTLGGARGATRPTNAAANAFWIESESGPGSLGLRGATPRTARSSTN